MPAGQARTELSALFSAFICNNQDIANPGLIIISCINRDANELPQCGSKKYFRVEKAIIMKKIS